MRLASSDCCWAATSVILGGVLLGGCFASHESPADPDSADAQVRRPWPGPGPAPDPCDAYAPAFAFHPWFEGREVWTDADTRTDPWVFDSLGRRCVPWPALCVLPDCGPDDLDEEGSAYLACTWEPNRSSEYGSYRSSDASSWCMFATRASCECECLSRCP